jgi:hypothetical protein
LKNLYLLVLLIIPYLATGQRNDLSQVYQYRVPVGSRSAYLWIPPHAPRIRGAIVAFANLLERQWLEDSLIRQVAANNGLGIIWIGPARKGDTTLTADMKPYMASAFVKMMDDFAEESGYSEIRQIPVIPTGHSANGHFAWTFANLFPQRTIACIAVKTAPLPDELKFKNIPFCYLVGQTTEWPQFRVPDPATQPGDRDFFWPVVKKSALKLRAESADNLISVVVDPGGGHFDWSSRLNIFMADYIRAACRYRLQNGSWELKPIRKEAGWLTDSGGMEPDQYQPSSYLNYRGNVGSSYWFFDQATAEAAMAVQGNRVPRKKQMLTFVQDDTKLPVAKLGFAPLKFEPDTDGLTFTLKGAFLDRIPDELINHGTVLGHAPGQISFSIIAGPAIKINDTTFRVRFGREAIGGDLWIIERHPGNAEYRSAVQSGKMIIPSKLLKGEPQKISFDSIPSLTDKKNIIVLKATSSAGLPVSFFVREGPAYVSGNILHITAIPIRAKSKVKITVVAYQWGRSRLPSVQSAEPVERSFYVLKKP